MHWPLDIVHWIALRALLCGRDALTGGTGGIGMHWWQGHLRWQVVIHTAALPQGHWGVGPQPCAMSQDSAARGNTGRRPPSESLPLDSLGESMAEYVTKQLGKGAAVLNLGSYATIKLGHNACPKSLLGMLGFAPVLVLLGP